MDFQYGDWLRPAFERGDEEPWESGPNPDLAILLEMTLRADRPLVGPPPAELLDPVPPEDILGEEPEHWDDLHDPLRPFADWMTAEIRQVQARSSTSS